MHVKNHMAMWILWILWIFRARNSANPLYKPFCAFLVFVDLMWIMCGRLCGFWSRVTVSILEIFDKDIYVLRYPGDWTCSFCGSVVLPSMLDADDCASSCSLWTDKKICPLPHFVLCSVSSPLEATIYKWRKRSWLERP